MSYRYDLFISYASEDRAWARALNDAMQARGVRCFIDDLRLLRGRQWEPQLHAALDDSRHFAVFWSERAQASDWVREEIVLFRQHVDHAAQKKIPEQRLLYAVNLDAARNAALGRFQGFVHPDLQAGYQASRDDMQLGAPAKAAWNAVVEEMTAGVRSDLVPQEVPVAALALTVAHLDTPSFAVPKFAFLSPGSGIDAVFDALGVGKLSDLDARYGPEVWDWKPHGSQETLTQILERLRSEERVGINARRGQHKLAPVQWKPIDLLAPPEDELEDLAKETCKVPCLLVVDPLSLFNSDIYRRYIRLSPFFASPNAAVMFPSLFNATESQSLLRRCLAAMGTPHLTWFHVPIPFRSDHAACGLNVADPFDLRRLLLASLGRSSQSDPFLHV